jgi:bacillithiol biosynthesis cysteine-adding enzyme BshC
MVADATPEGAIAAVLRARRPLQPEVHRALAAQNAALAPSPARDAHLAALASAASPAAAVVTGQQVGLFLGPLYTVYKAASAVAVARALAAAAGAPVVPVFWLQTEDHDVAEIASCGVPGRGACEMIAVPADAGSRVSVAHLRLPDEVAGCLDAIEALIGDGAAAGAHLGRLRRHYRPGARWADAFAGVLAELFAPEGLVVIDPRDPALAAAAAPVHARAIGEAERIASALIAHDAELARAGHKTPVHVRPGAPLSFFHPDGAEGPRVRLAPAGGDRFAEVGGERRFDRAELLAALRDDPRRCSTSALLRPIVQDALLPTAAYVGGPGEIAYLAQMPPLYRAFERTPPLVVPRAGFRLVDARARRLLERLGLAAADAERGEAELLARLRRAWPGGAAAERATGAAAPGTADEISRRLLGPFAREHAQLAAELAHAGPQIAKALARTRASVERAVGRLAAKVERAALYEDASLVEAVRALRARLAPGGAPQERVLGLPGPAAWLGDRALIERVLAAIAQNPFDPTLQELG